MFSLFEAMSAIEMMDPKMDAGLVCNRKKVLTFVELVQNDLLKVKDFGYDELIGIIDETLACLVTWLKGHSFVQTIWINLYLHDPSLIEDKCLRTFCYAILEISEIISRFISRADVSEDEDFAPLFDIPVANLANIKLNAMFKETEEELQRRISKQSSQNQQSNGQSNQKSNQESNQESSQESNQAEANSEPIDHSAEIQALLNRMRLTKELHNFMQTLSREVLDHSRVPKKGQQPKLNCVSLCEKLTKSLDVLQRMNTACKTTVSFGITVDESLLQSTANRVRGDYPTILGFSPMINQKLLPITFPRDVTICDRQLALDYLESLFGRLQLLLQIYNQTSFVSAYNFISDFSVHSWHDACILTRSILQTLYFPSVFVCFGVTPLNEMLREDAIRYVKPLPMLPKSPLLTTESKELIDLFFRNCQNPFSELIVASGFNRTRQRKKLSALLDDFANSIDEAINLDAYFSTLSRKLGFEPGSHLYFTTWVMYYILRICVTFVLSGFALELYAPHEYPYLYCYLSEFLFNWMHENLDRAGNMSIDNERVHAKMLLETKVIKSKHSNHSKASKKQSNKSKPHFQELLSVQATRFLCDGLYKTVCGLDMERRIRRPALLLNDEMSRYDQRFEGLKRTQFPIAVDYAQYEDKMSWLRTICPNPKDYYGMAQRSFRIAKDSFEAILDKKQLVSTLILAFLYHFCLVLLLIQKMFIFLCKCRL
jgi:hypothetical protein